ncbi:ABC transporter ATP-binding protein [Solirhodobacter olei]|uniref:ABC transporter ATP-binding protein n=1 Tax=Solirhodobacter olei TaxID=2493082 RepID=UPI000FDB3647|nr:ABC transporter ATP-binding protein [Solirhodobacter olei]
MTPPSAELKSPGRIERGRSQERMDVRLENVTKRFGDTIAVDDLSLTIESGEFFSLLGSSGCGKTTTLSMIGGFQEPSSGAIYLSGTDVSHLPPYRRDVNTVFQSYALFPHLDVFENVAFGLRRKRVGNSEIEARVKDVLRLVDLTGYEKRKPALLSGGQQQRVALARALVNRPKLLLLDEPLGALDLKLRKQMQIELKRIQSEVGITFLYVTHDQEEAIVMSDRLAVMANGKIEQVGPPDQVYDSPATEFVAGFLGASNMMSGDIEGESGANVSVRLAGGQVLLVPSARLQGRGPRIRLGVRPEKILVLPSGESVGADWNSLEGTVELSVYTGIGHQYTIRDAEGRSFTVYVQNRDARPPGQGEVVRIAWRPDHTFVVKPTTTGTKGSTNNE